MTKSKPTADIGERDEIAARDAARGYTDADRAEALDDPDWTDAELAAVKPFAEMFPDAAASIRRGRGPQRAPTKLKINLRLAPDVVEHYKKTGPGWQVRMGEILRKGAGL